MSRKKIVYVDLPSSPFIAKVDNIQYNFSTEKHMTKFIQGVESNRGTVSEAIEKRYGFAVYADVLADLSLYKQIETRGFYIIANGVEYKWVKQVQLSGVKVTQNALATL